MSSIIYNSIEGLCLVSEISIIQGSTYYSITPIIDIVELCKDAIEEYRLTNTLIGLEQEISTYHGVPLSSDDLIELVVNHYMEDPNPYDETLLSESEAIELPSMSITSGIYKINKNYYWKINNVIHIANAKQGVLLIDLEIPSVIEIVDHNEFDKHAKLISLYSDGTINLVCEIVKLYLEGGLQ